MEITCDQCQSRLNVPDDKIPPNQAVRLNCPKCMNKITVDPRKHEAPGDESPESQVERDNFNLNFIESRKSEGEQEVKYSYDDYSDDLSLSFFGEDSRLALVMPRDEIQAEAIKAAVEELKYKSIRAANIRDALGKMRFHHFDLILLAEGFDNQGLELNPVVNFLNHISISVRRKIFLALIGDHLKTMDDMMAFALSVNMVINPKDMEKAVMILKKGIGDSQKVHKVFMDTLVEVGKA